MTQQEFIDRTGLTPTATMENVFTTSTPTLGDRIKGKLFEAWYIPFAKLRSVAQRIALPFIIAQRRRL